MGDSALNAFAERHDLDYVGQVAPGVGPIPGEGVDEVAGGTLPGGLEGLLAPYAQRLDGDTSHVRDCCLLLTRVPESAVFLPYVTCRDDVVRGFADRMIGPGGLIPVVEHVEFESIELNHRYRIGAFKGIAQDRLRQLFTPTLIDWMASTAPDGLYFELFSGMLKMTVTTGKVTDEAQLDRVCELATHIVERIRAESAESVAGDGTPQFTIPPQQAEYERKRADTLAAAAFTSPPADFEEALARVEPAVKGKSTGLLRKVFKSIDRGEAADLALEALIRGYGQRRGLVWQRPTDFLGRHVDLPVPIAPKQALRGRLPGLGVEGDLFVHGGVGMSADTPVSPGAGLPGKDPDAILVASPVSEFGQERMTIGGFQVGITGGGNRRVSEESKHDAEVASAIAGELDNRFQVLAHRCEPGQTLSPAMRDWLLARDAKDTMLEMGGGTLVVVSDPAAAKHWTTATLDEFCGSLAPLVA